MQVEREVTEENSYDSYLLAEELAKSVESEGGYANGSGPHAGEAKEAAVERKITEVSAPAPTHLT